MQKVITTKVLTQGALPEAEGIWKEIELATPNVPLVCSWNVVSTWIATYADILTYWFVVGYDGNNPIGITLVTKETKRWIPVPVNAYHLGTQGEPLKDWIHMVNNNILVIPDYRAAFIQALTKTLLTEFSWEAFLIEDADTPFADAMFKELKKSSLTIRRVTETCHYINVKELRDAGKTAMDAFSKDTRYQIRRSLKEFENLTVEEATTAKEALDIFTELQKLHQDSLIKKGKRGSYSSKRFTAFHTNLIEKYFDPATMLFFRVKSDKFGTLGCFYLLIDNGVAFGYSSGMNDFTNLELTSINKKRLKPGFVMHALCLQACLNRGVNEYNFSTGSEGYKQELTSERGTLTTLKIQRSLKSKLREALMESYLKAEEQQQFRMVIKPLYTVYKKFTS